MILNTVSVNPPIIAHRGASGFAPENTMAAFTQAALQGAKWVEFDVMIAACGTPIVFHDETLKRVAGIKGRIKNLPYSYLRTVDVGRWFNSRFAGETIPSLEMVLEWLKANNMYANIEIKPLPGEDVSTVERAVPVINQYFPQPNTSILFSSFSLSSLTALRAALPDAYLGFLMHDWDAKWSKYCDDLNCVTMNVNEEILTQERVTKIKNTGRQLLSYTVNDLDRVKELFSMGVDAVFSDYPGIMLGTIENKIL